MVRRASLILLVLLLFSLLLSSGCRDRGIETIGTVIRKEVRDGNQYWLHVEYTAVIDGREGIFNASIKVVGRAEFDRYNVGDTYKFTRPRPQ